jgi:hypothetical protein
VNIREKQSAHRLWKNRAIQSGKPGLPEPEQGGFGKRIAGLIRSQGRAGIGGVVGSVELIDVLHRRTRCPELFGRCGVAVNHEDWVGEADGGKTDHGGNDKEDFAQAEGLDAD